MYDLHDYARMIADGARMGPYVRALEAVVRPGSVVADIGSGTGVLALVACRLGARRVYAIEANDSIEVARELARENGFADRIVFFQRDAREVELPERADVVVSDLRGALPIFGEHLAIIAEVRERFLKQGGVLVPECDRLMVAVVSDESLYSRALGGESGPLGLTLTSMRRRLVNTPYWATERNNLWQREAIVSPAQPWAHLEYATVRATPVSGRAELCVDRSTTAHGLAVWFDTVLAGHHGFSSTVDELNCYGGLFLPWPHSVFLSQGDSVIAELWAQPDGEPWGWNSSLPKGSRTRELFKQSSFLGQPSSRFPAQSAAPEQFLSSTTQT